MTEQLLMAHDIGTSATKTSLVTSEGVVLDTQSHAHATSSPQPGWSEQNPCDWWEGVCKNTRLLMGRHTDCVRRIAAIGVSGHMLGAVLLDRDGRPLRPALLHSDTRGTSELERVLEVVSKDKVYETTGNILDGRSSLCKCRWLQRHEPEVWKRTHRLMQSKDYIVGKMIGAFETTDFSDASHAQLLDIGSKTYAQDMLDALDINPDILPRPRASIEIAGHLSVSSAKVLGLPSGIPISVGGGDGVCASAGAGAVSDGEAYCCFGTTAWVSLTARRPYFDPGRRLFDIVALDGQSIGVLGTVQCAGRSIDWMRRVFQENDFQQMDALVDSVEPGSDGLIMLPYLEGERATIYDANAQGVFFGLTPNHERQHFLRATVEGVCFGLSNIVEIMREQSTVESFGIIGGAARSGALRRILASACNARVSSLSVNAADATSLGAAIAAGVGVGMFKTLADGVKNIHIIETDNPDSRATEIYNKGRKRQMEIYQCLKSVF